MALDIQMLLGLVLYLGVSPNMKEILAHFGDAMKDPATRFWAVEHITAMFAAVVVAHVGRVLARKARTPASKRTRLLVCFALATILMLAGMPWPGRPGGRVLFRV
jgi:heme A synthase